MNKPISPIDAIAPAIQRTREILFRPFDAGKWLILGFLTFLQALGGGEGYGELRFPLGWRNADWPWKTRSDAFGWALDKGTREAAAGSMAEGAGSALAQKASFDWSEGMRDGSWCLTNHPVLTGGLLFVFVLLVLAVVVLFVWLSSRATFCYIDSVANNRAEVVRPWTQHGRIADSYFFWRLLLAILMLCAVAAFMVPFVLSMMSMANAGEEPDVWRVLFGGGVLLVTLPALVVLVLLYALLRVFLNDFVAPIQYVRGISCGDAFKILRQLMRANPGVFLFYIVMRILIWLVVYFGLTVLGCATCCILFCCWMIPVIGQAVLQPFHVFTRSYSLCFLQGFGAEFDVYPRRVQEPPPAGPAAGMPQPI